MEWTPARIRRLREVGLCLSQDGFGRFLAALVSAQTANQAIPAFLDRGHRLAPTLDGLRGAVLDWPLAVRMDMSENSAQEMAAVAQVHRRYQLADYDSAAQLLPAVLIRLHAQPGALEGNDECRIGTLTTQHTTAAAYIAAAKLATKLGDSSLAWVTADRALTAANESGHTALVGVATWLWTAFGPTNVAIHHLSVHASLGSGKRAMQLGATINTDGLSPVLRGRRSRVHLDLSWAAANQADDALAVLHLLAAERVAEQAVSRNASAKELLSTLLKRERRGATPGLRGLAARAGLLQ